MTQALTSPTPGEQGIPLSPQPLAARFAEVRRDLYGEHGIPALVDSLELPQRTWMNYEAGVVMPATVLLRFLDLTSVEPRWLLTGEGPKYSRTSPVVRTSLPASAP